MQIKRRVTNKKKKVFKKRVKKEGKKGRSKVYIYIYKIKNVSKHML